MEYVMQIAAHLNHLASPAVRTGNENSEVDWEVRDLRESTRSEAWTLRGGLLRSRHIAFAGGTDQTND